MVKAIIFRSPWGWMGIAESVKGLQAVSLPRPTRQATRSCLRDSAGSLLVEAATPRLRRAKGQLLRYLAGKNRSFTLPLDIERGTVFQRRVWRALRRVPYGTLRSYQWLATQVGGRRYARAVGNAVGANPLPIVIPCHRVVAHDASLGGFSSGLPMKRKLLRLEGTLRMLRNGRRTRSVKRIS